MTTVTPIKYITFIFLEGLTPWVLPKYKLLHSLWSLWCGKVTSVQDEQDDLFLRSPNSFHKAKFRFAKEKKILSLCLVLPMSLPAVGLPWTRNPHRRVAAVWWLTNEFRRWETQCQTCLLLRPLCRGEHKMCLTYIAPVWKKVIPKAISLEHVLSCLVSEQQESEKNQAR